MARTKLEVVRQLCVVASFLLVTGIANAGNGQSPSAAEEGAEEAFKGRVLECFDRVE